jgi:lipopolysaccharide transport system permease protein
MATVIKPTAGSWRINFGELWRYREVMYFLAWRDIKVKYKQTVLGAAWAVIQPATLMVIFTLVFTRMVKIPDVGIPYPLYVYAGLVAWTFFATAVSSAGNSVVNSERLITKVYFDRLTIPVAAVAAVGVDFAISLGLLAVMLSWYQLAPGATVVVLPMVVLAIGLAAMGMGILLAALNVSYRDFRYVIPFLVQVWMWATPVIYAKPSAGGSKVLEVALRINPMYGLIGTFRGIVVGEAMNWIDFSSGAAGAVLLFALGCLYYRRVEDRFADLI